MKKSLLLVILISFSTANASDTCTKSDIISGTRKESAEITRIAQLEALRTNANSFCNYNKLRSDLENYPTQPSQALGKSIVRQMSDKDVLKTDQAMDTANDTDGYTGVFESVPLESYRQGVARDNIVMPSSEGGMGAPNGKNFQQVLDKAEAVINSNPCGLSDQKGSQTFADLKTDNGLDSISGDPTDSLLAKAVEKITPVAAAGACYELTSISQISSCSKSVMKMQNKMRQRDSFTSMPDLLDKIVNSGAFDKGLQIAAKKIIENARHSDQVKSDAFTDIKESFQQAGYSVKAAEQMTFETLGMISTAGPSLGRSFSDLSFPKDRWPTVTSLTAIASLTQYLDFHTAKNGHVYSFPPGVKGSCDTSKSYYFWMAAYLSRSAAQEGAAPATASAAAYTACKGYHVLGNLTNRRGSSDFFTEDTFSPESNVNRADLAYASSGALYGAGVDLKTPLSIDDGIAISIQNSKVSPALTEANAEKAASPFRGFGYYKFKDMFAPNEIYESQEKDRDFTNPPPALASIPKQFQSAPVRCQ